MEQENKGPGVMVASRSSNAVNFILPKTQKSPMSFKQINRDMDNVANYTTRNIEYEEEKKTHNFSQYMITDISQSEENENNEESRKIVDDLYDLENQNLPQSNERNQ